MHSLLVISAAGLASLLAYLKVKGNKAGSNAVVYHAKFSGMAVAIGLLATLSWPLMALRQAFLPTVLPNLS